MSERVIYMFGLLIPQSAQEAILNHFSEIPDKNRPVIVYHREVDVHDPIGRKPVYFYVECGENDEKAVKKEFNKALGYEHFKINKH